MTHTIFDKEYLRSRGWSAYKLAQKSGISEPVVYKIMKGEGLPSMVTARALLACFDLNLLTTHFPAEKYAQPSDVAQTIQSAN